MNPYEFDVLVIGGGCIGASIFYELSRNGFGSLALVDSGRKTLSATASSGGMLRVFHESPKHIDLAISHHEHLLKLQNAKILTEKMRPNGSLYFFNKTRYPNYKRNLLKMEQAKYPFEVLNSETGRSQFSQYNWAADEMAIYEPLGSHLNTQQYSTDLLNFGVENGARLFENFEVRRICSYGERYRVSGENGTITAKKLILAGGARLIPRLRDLGLKLSLESKTLSNFTVETSKDDFEKPNFFDRENLEYARFGFDQQTIFSNLSTSRMRIKTWRGVIDEKSAEDCYAPNRIGFAGQVPGHPGLLIAMGWGGTAFKFSLEIGKRIAEAASCTLPERKIIYA